MMRLFFLSIFLITSCSVVPKLKRHHLELVKASSIYNNLSGNIDSNSLNGGIITTASIQHLTFHGSSISSQAIETLPSKNCKIALRPKMIRRVSFASGVNTDTIASNKNEAARKNDKKAVSAFVLAIGSLLLPPFSIFLSIPSFILSIEALHELKQNSDLAGYGFAMAGLIISIAVMFMLALGLIWVIGTALSSE